MAKKIHSEKQRFGDNLLFAVLGLLLAASLYGVVHFAMLEPALPVRAFTCLALSVFLGGSIWFLTKLRYKLSVTKKHIGYKISAFNDRKEKIRWSDVSSCQIVKTPKLAQWHGSNLSYGGEKFISLCGRNGLEITTRNGQHFFLGSDDVDNLQHAIKKMKLSATG